ncbi:hypothetical protein AG0111_0g3436 [Alternaria gaisen]|uniref:Uncharacterized protein n=1 Tax=Alternaria gaisen TaxID=167740 RepID=A0ACB6FWK8_9PLEO|nr:hypothetical protein AG0111_0g3436 [Alternaria gaisen]
MTEESELVTIDPNGDMLIILKDPNTALLEWKEDKDLLEETIAQAAAEATQKHLAWCSMSPMSNFKPYRKRSASLRSLGSTLLQTITRWRVSWDYSQRSG